MDKFLTSSVPRPLDATTRNPTPGYIVYGFANFADSGPYGFKGVLDPTFGGLPVTASSPLECNTKATRYALDYNKYAWIKYNDAKLRAQYDTDMARYEYLKSIGANSPVQPKRPEYQIPIEYTASDVLFFDQIATQTMRCTSEGACGPSSGDRRAFITEDNIWVFDSASAGSIPSVQDVVWSFVADAAAAPFGRQCQIHFRPVQPVREVISSNGRNDASVTGVGNSDCGAQTLATVPYIRDGCAPSRVGMTLAPECTVLAEDHGRLQTTDGWAWYVDGLPDTGSYSKTSAVEGVCRLYPSLQECDCIAREERPNFNLFRANFTSTTDACWYLPCSRPGSDRLVTPADAEARLHCSPDVCQSITNVVNSENIDLKDVQNTINCSTEQYEAGMKNAADGGADAGGVVAGITDKISGIASGLGTETIVAIVVLAVAVVLMSLAAWLYFSSSSSRPAFAIAAAAASVEPPPAVTATAAPAAPAAK